MPKRSNNPLVVAAGATVALLFLTWLYLQEEPTTIPDIVDSKRATIINLSTIKQHRLLYSRELFGPVGFTFGTQATRIIPGLVLILIIAIVGATIYILQQRNRTSLSVEEPYAHDTTLGIDCAFEEPEFKAESKNPLIWLVPAVSIIIIIMLFAAFRWSRADTVVKDEPKASTVVFVHSHEHPPVILTRNAELTMKDIYDAVTSGKDVNNLLLFDDQGMFLSERSESIPAELHVVRVDVKVDGRELSCPKKFIEHFKGYPDNYLLATGKVLTSPFSLYQVVDTCTELKEISKVNVELTTAEKELLTDS